MSEKLDKLRASLEKEKERRIKINNRIESLEPDSGSGSRRSERDGSDGKGHAGTAGCAAAAVYKHYPEPGCAVRSRCYH